MATDLEAFHVFLTARAFPERDGPPVRRKELAMQKQYKIL
jgi:hypothetical protein